MKVLTVGGGSGGHVTPVIAVIAELKRLHPKAEIRFWCDYKFSKQASGLIDKSGYDVHTSRIVAGKFRRYHHLSLWQQLVWIELVLLNIRDLFLVFVGFIQSLVKLIIWRPNVVFTKGGFVCLPVGYAARVLRIPLVIHDSDAHPGLTNRLLSKFAKYIATGAPLEYYNYPKEKAKYVGIPIMSSYRPVSSKEQKLLKQQWGIETSKPTVLITGGGLGASRLNDATVLQLDDLLKNFNVVLISGSMQYDELKSLVPKNSDRFQLYPFVSEGMPEIMASADIVVSRAGATTLLELAALAKPTVIIPNGRLVGGHQLKNAKVYADAEAVVIIDENDLESDPHVLTETLENLISNRHYMVDLSRRFNQFAKLDAASEVANMVVSASAK